MDMNQYHGLVTFLRGERLKDDGSNFVDWYLYLRTVLKRANLLFVIQERMGDPPVDNMDEKVMLDYHNHRRTYAMVKSVIETSFPQDLREQYADMDTFDTIDMMKSLFIHQFRVARFELENEFLTTKMEENTCLKTHVAKMHGIHLKLVEDFDYWTTEESAINTVLHSLPPSYTDFVHDYVGRGESLQFFEFMVNLRDLEVEPIEGEIVDGEGICLIYSL
jgi:hypothetical protein